MKIADFGLSRIVIPDQVMTLPVGTLTYVAPEVLLQTGYGIEADVWSVGVIMFLLLRGKLPFDGYNRVSLFGLIWRPVHSFHRNARSMFDSVLFFGTVLTPLLFV